MTAALMRDLSGFQRDLLFVIAGMESPSGQTIKAEFARELDKQVSHGLLYPNLDDLVEAGLVEKGERDRRTNYYRLTDRGRDALRERLAWERERCRWLQVDETS